MTRKDEKHDFEISPMTIEDHGEVMALWLRSDGVGLSDADERSSNAASRHFGRPV